MRQFEPLAFDVSWVPEPIASRVHFLNISDLLGDDDTPVVRCGTAPGLHVA
jgi:hypothetical protein